MQDAFGYVLFGVVIVGVLVALVTFAMSGGAYDQIGKGGFYRDDDDGARHSAPGGAVDVAERDAEIRQMLTARNARRVRKGQAPLDVDSEVARQVRDLGG